MESDVLRHEFGINVALVEEARGGFSAHAYRVRDAAGRHWFLKAYDRRQASVRPWIERIDAYIEPQGWLAETPELGGRVPRPVRALGGRYKVEQVDHVYLLLEYVEGETPGYGAMSHSQTVELMSILAALHGLDIKRMPFDVEKLHENTSLWFCDSLFAQLDDWRAGFMQPHAALLRAAADRASRLRDQHRLNARGTCLCHTDAHGGNVIQAADRLVLVDWEGLCVAPPESDLFLFAGEPDWPTYLETYVAARPGFVLNGELLRFYQIRRQLEDIEADLTRLIHDAPDKAVRAETMRTLHDCIHTLQALM